MIYGRAGTYSQRYWSLEVLKNVMIYGTFIIVYERLVRTGI